MSHFSVNFGCVVGCCCQIAKFTACCCCCACSSHEYRAEAPIKDKGRSIIPLCIYVHTWYDIPGRPRLPPQLYNAVVCVVCCTVINYAYRWSYILLFKRNVYTKTRVLKHTRHCLPQRWADVDNAPTPWVIGRRTLTRAHEQRISRRMEFVRVLTAVYNGVQWIGRSSQHAIRHAPSPLTPASSPCGRSCAVGDTVLAAVRSWFFHASDR